jgi:hypothetical protein
VIHWFKRIVRPQVFIEEKTALQARGLATGLDVTLLATVTVLLLVAALHWPVWAAALLLEALVWEGARGLPPVIVIFTWPACILLQPF